MILKKIRYHYPVPKQCISHRCVLVYVSKSNALNGRNEREHAYIVHMAVDINLIKYYVSEHRYVFFKK